MNQSLEKPKTLTFGKIKKTCPGLVGIPPNFTAIRYSF